MGDGRLNGRTESSGGNYKNSELGVLTDRPGTPTNDFFVNLLDPQIERRRETPEDDFKFVGTDRETGELKYRVTRFDLTFVADSELGQFQRFTHLKEALRSS